MKQILKEDLNSPSKFREKFKGYISHLRGLIQDSYKINFDDKEISELLLSACRSNDFNVINRQKNKLFLDKNKVLCWLNNKLIPSTVIIKLKNIGMTSLMPKRT